ncbi:hypothetical protein BGZ70_002278 [Mortierella alpina]|uniref:C2H2-type domain-containing protein n=1 Tax=Mortierella alpina TaxID=64518 RepID=A0A9P6IUS0_MORAP|nr:hypothetical protein BGZ70_002278 [Mortierella alpina]
MPKTSKTNVRKCVRCDPEVTFKSSAQERSHELEYHALQFVVRAERGSALKSDVTVYQVDGKFPCPSCLEKFSTKSNIRRHLIRGSCNSNVDEEPTLPPVTLSALPKIAAAMPPTIENSSVKRDHDLAVIAACNQQDQTVDEKRKTLFIVEALALRPFLLRDVHGIERPALALAGVVDKLAEQEVTVCLTDLPRQSRNVKDEPCSACAPTVAPGFEQLLAISPFTSKLLSRTFVEVYPSIAALLNEDWTDKPQLRYACAQILAGSVFYNTGNGQSVLNNTVEMYGRKQSIDSHRERFVVKKGTASRTSIPPANSRYKDLWPLTLQDPEGDKLVLGTHSFSLLVTSSIRLDVKGCVSVGGATSSFRLQSHQESFATRIFLDQESIATGLMIAQDEHAAYVSSKLKTEQLRQIRSKFHDGSTYLLCRASGFLTWRHTCLPYTVFTVADHDQSQSKDGSAASMLFQDLARNVWKQGSSAVLQQQRIKELKDSCTPSGNVRQLLENIESCFREGEQSIRIIGNKELNSHLESLARGLSSYITNHNKSVAAFVEECFDV